MILHIGFGNKTYKLEITKEQAGALVGKKIGDVIDGDVVGLPGYKLEITGGSDTSGFPMRKGIHTQAKVSVLIGSRPGFWRKRKGERRKKMVRGEVVSLDIAQLNTKVVEKGSVSLDELLGKEEKSSEAA